MQFLLSPANAENILGQAGKYAVRVKASIGYPYEDKAGTFNGAGFLFDKERVGF